MNSKIKKSITLKMKDKDYESSEVKKLTERSLSINTIQLQKSNYHTGINTPGTNKDTNIEIVINDKTKITEQENMRKDFKGNPIIKGKGKKHHITFKDFTGRVGLVEFVNIPKIKEEDYEEEEGNPKKKKSNEEVVSCTCLIF